METMEKSFEEFKRRCEYHIPGHRKERNCKFYHDELRNVEIEIPNVPCERDHCPRLTVQEREKKEK